MEAVHFDPLNAVLILIAMVGGYKAFISNQTSLKQSSDQHDVWIAQHTHECDVREQTWQQIIREMQVSNAKLAEMCTSLTRRLDRLEQQQDSWSRQSHPRPRV